MVELDLKKRRQMMGEYEYSEHSESCGYESVTGITEEDTQERE